MEAPFEYYAFISYKRKDEKQAKWLQKKLETYKIPTALAKEVRKELPKNFHPCFRDKTDLSETGDLDKILRDKLQKSQYLIVICSPRSAKSPWVNREVEIFQEMGRADKIIPYIIEGNPDSSNPNTHCYPTALSEKILGVSVPELGKDKAVVKTVAVMLNINFDILWNRERRRKRRTYINIALISLLLIGCISLIIKKITDNKDIIYEPEKAYLTIYEKSKKTGNFSEALYELYCKLNIQYNQENKIQINNLRKLDIIKFSPIDSSKILILENNRQDAFVWDINLNKLEYNIDKRDTISFNKIFYSNNGKYVFGLLNNNTMCIWDEKGQLIKSFNGYIDRDIKIWRDSIFFDKKSLIKNIYLRKTNEQYQEDYEKYQKLNEENNNLIDLFYESYFREIYLIQNIFSNPIWSMDGKYIVLTPLVNKKEIRFEPNYDLYEFDYKRFCKRVSDFSSRECEQKKANLKTRIYDSDATVSDCTSKCKSISPDNKLGVAVYVDGFKILNLSDKNIKNEKIFHIQDIINIYITTDGKYIVFYTSSKLYIVNPQTQKIVSISVMKEISNIILSPNSRVCYVIFIDKTISIYDMGLSLVNISMDALFAKNVSIDSKGENILFYDDSLIVSHWLGFESLYNYILNKPQSDKATQFVSENSLETKNTQDYKWYHKLLFMVGVYLLFKFLYNALFKKEK